MTEQEQFLAYIDSLPWDDESGRLVYSDWLIEHDQIEEATRQKQYVPARKWLEDFASQCGQHCENYSEVWNTYFNETRNMYGREYDAVIEAAGERAQNAEKRITITYEMVIQIGMDWIESGGNDYFTQLGSERARDMFYEHKEEFWHNWSIVTGIKVEQDLKENPFSCSC